MHVINYIWFNFSMNLSICSTSVYKKSGNVYKIMLRLKVIVLNMAPRIIEFAYIHLNELNFFPSLWSLMWRNYAGFSFG